MGFAFVLCPECLARYGALRFDPTASYGVCSIPLCSLVWADEHPGGAPLDDPDGPHQQCRASVMRLAGARTQLWRSGSVPEDLRELWDAARWRQYVEQNLPEDEEHHPKPETPPPPSDY